MWGASALPSVLWLRGICWANQIVQPLAGKEVLEGREASMGTQCLSRSRRFSAGSAQARPLTRPPGGRRGASPWIRGAGLALCTCPAPGAWLSWEQAHWSCLRGHLQGTAHECHVRPGQGEARESGTGLRSTWAARFGVKHRCGDWGDEVPGGSRPLSL